MEKELATHSSLLTWRIPCIEDPGGGPWDSKELDKTEQLWPTEVENMKKRWKAYTEDLYNKDLHDPDIHGGVITHLESDILECEVKWVLGSITTNKASGGDGIPV